METLQDCNRRQNNTKIGVNLLAFDSRNEWDNNITQPGTNSTSSKMTTTSIHEEKEEFPPPKDMKMTPIRTKQKSKTDLLKRSVITGCDPL